jgi:hypothetical protein
VSGAAGVGLVAGCDLGGSGPDASTSAPSGSAAGSASESPSTSAGDPDAALVDEVLTELTAMVSLVGAVGSRVAGLAGPMRALRRMHLAHIAALDGSTRIPAHGRVPGSPAAALALVRRRETRLHSQLVDAAVEARSGVLARLLASMSAAVSQHLATLPRSAA